MPWGIFFANQDDTGTGFQDPDSGIDYINESKQEVGDKAAYFNEYGSGADIRTTNGEPLESQPDTARFNTTVLQVDAEGFYYPAPYEPGG
jgi:hypothetical protein